MPLQCPPIQLLRQPTSTTRYRVGFLSGMEVRRGHWRGLGLPARGQPSAALRQVASLTVLSAFGSATTLRHQSTRARAPHLGSLTCTDLGLRGAWSSEARHPGTSWLVIELDRRATGSSFESRRRPAPRFSPSWSRAGLPLVCELESHLPRNSSSV